MTHEELLAKIAAMDGILYIHNETFEGMGKGDKALLALRAVVKYHEPFEFTWGGETEIACYCGEIYPCPTIEAINRELNE